MSVGRYKYICIEGCMGAGKTTLARELAATLAGKPVLEESKRHPFIREFYSDPKAYALETELAFILLHYHQLIRERRGGAFEGVVVGDFAFERDHVFATLTLKEPENWAIFETVYNALKKRLPVPDVLIYLRAPVEFLVQRMFKRARDYEKDMPRSYLEAVNTALDVYFLNEYQGRKVVFNAPELDSSTNPDCVAIVVSKLASIRN